MFKCATPALPARFNPQQFDARAWVRLAQEIGMKYIVLTAKHHDQDAGRLEIQVPARAPDPAVSVIVVRTKE